MNRQELIALIKDKKEFRNLENQFVEQILEFYMASKILEKLNKKEITVIVKKTRAKLREVYGAFITKSFLKRYKLLNNIKTLKDIEAHKKILKLHISSKERIFYYEEIYSKIFEITGKPKSILDLGCGLNPLSFPFMKIKPEYFAFELVKEDTEFIQNYFDKLKIKGKAITVDLMQFENKFPKTDVCFLFKLLDTLESLRWDISEKILKNLNSRWFVVSFSTKSLGGKKTLRERVWFEKLIKDYEFVKFSVANELFYVIKQKH